MGYPASFDEANFVLDKPQGMSHEECGALSIWRGATEGGKPVVISCWKFTQEELEEINRTGRVWLMMYGETTQPAAVCGVKPFGGK